MNVADVPRFRQRSTTRLSLRPMNYPGVLRKSSIVPRQMSQVSIIPVPRKVVWNLETIAARLSLAETHELWGNRRAA
jgi:hypothetical protein